MRRAVPRGIARRTAQIVHGTWGPVRAGQRRMVTRCVFMPLSVFKRTK